MEIRDRVPFFRRPALLVITLPFLILPFGSSLAEGLAVSAQSASAAAVAVAGVAAGVDDAATVFYNPAGMTRLTINEVTAAIGIVRSSLRPSQTRGLDVLGGPMQGTTGAQNVTNIVPSIYAVFVPAKNLRLGVGVSTPFGQRLAYDSRWLGRYEVQDAQLQDNSLSLAAAYQVSEFVSFGGSVDYHQAKVKRISAVDFGATCAGILGLGPCGFLGLLPQQTDGKARLEVSGNGLGYKLGVTADYRNGWRTGLVYRSPVKLNLGGDLRFEVPVTAGVLNATGAFDPTNAYSHFTLPESLHWGLSWDVEDRTRILLGVNWSRWSRLSALQVTFDNPAQAPVNQPLHWHNSLNYSVGVRHVLSSTIALQAGIGHHQSPVDSTYASPLFPIGDANEVDLGFAWKLNAKSEVTFSYGYQKHKSLQYANSNPFSGQVSGSLRQHLHALGLQLNQKF